MSSGFRITYLLEYVVFRLYNTHGRVLYKASIVVNAYFTMCQ